MADRILLCSERLEDLPIQNESPGPEDGAMLVFSGNVRQMEGETPLRAISYQAYGSMAEKKIQEILNDAHSKWPPFEAIIAHRTGDVQVAEASVWIRVTSAHRDECYAVSRYIIDELKARVPIWKRDHLADAESS